MICVTGVFSPFRQHSMSTNFICREYTLSTSQVTATFSLPNRIAWPHLCKVLHNIILWMIILQLFLFPLSFIAFFLYSVIPVLFCLFSVCQDCLHHVFPKLFPSHCSICVIFLILWQVHSVASYLYQPVKVHFVMAALCSRCRHYIFALLFFLFSIFFISSPILSRRRLDAYHALLLHMV